jgi:hypothetical protein
VNLIRMKSRDGQTTTGMYAYVGCDARQSGTFQGEMIADLGIDKLDMNKNGKVDYVMIEGDPENVDAQYRTEFSVKGTYRMQGTARLTSLMMKLATGIRLQLSSSVAKRTQPVWQ